MKTDTGKVPRDKGQRLEECIDKPRNAGDCWQPQSWIEARKDFPPEPPDKVQPCPCLHFRPPASRSETVSSVVCSRLLFRQPWKTTTPEVSPSGAQTLFPLAGYHVLFPPPWVTLRAQPHCVLKNTAPPTLLLHWGNYPKGLVTINPQWDLN